MHRDRRDISFHLLKGHDNVLALREGSPLTLCSTFTALFEASSHWLIDCRLAYAKSYLTAAMMHRLFDTELFKTKEADVDMAHDFVIACTRLDLKGVRVRNRAENECNSKGRHRRKCCN